MFLLLCLYILYSNDYYIIIHPMSPKFSSLLPLQFQSPFGNRAYPRFFSVHRNPPTLEQDWRAFRAQLVASEAGGNGPGLGNSLGMMIRSSGSWVHPIPHPERGCLLIARNHYKNLGIHDDAVVLITEHDDKIGTSGLMVNMRLPFRISSLGLEDHLTASFGNCPLHWGGSIERNLLHVVHGRGDVEGSMRLVDGVFTGGVEHAAELVRLGLARPEEFKLVSGFNEWAPDQLAYEIWDEQWWVVSASKSVIMECLSDSPTPPSWGLEEVGGMKMDSKTRCWAKVLKASGIRY